MNSDIETSAELEALCASISTDLLAPWLDADTLRATAYEFEMKDISCPKEILLIAAVLRYLGNTTSEHANDEDRDGFVLSADETRTRAIRYGDTFISLMEIWS